LSEHFAGLFATFAIPTLDKMMTMTKSAHPLLIRGEQLITHMLVYSSSASLLAREAIRRAKA
jgi:hypothetical protein